MRLLTFDLKHCQPLYQESGNERPARLERRVLSGEEAKGNDRMFAETHEREFARAIRQDLGKIHKLSKTSPGRYCEILLLLSLVVVEHLLVVLCRLMTYEIRSTHWYF